MDYGILGCELYSVCLFLVYEINCGKTSVELLCMDGKICTLEWRSIRCFPCDRSLGFRVHMCECNKTWCEVEWGCSIIYIACPSLHVARQSTSHEGAKVITTMKIIHEQEVSERDPQSLKNHKNSYVSVILVHKGRGWLVLYIDSAHQTDKALEGDARSPLWRCEEASRLSHVVGV